MPIVSTRCSLAPARRRRCLQEAARRTGRATRCSLAPARRRRRLQEAARRTGWATRCSLAPARRLHARLAELAPVEPRRRGLSSGEKVARAERRAVKRKNGAAQGCCENE